MDQCPGLNRAVIKVVVGSGDRQVVGGIKTLGFTTGNPRVGFSHTIPEPVYTIPTAGMGTH